MNTKSETPKQSTDAFSQTKQSNFDRTGQTIWNSKQNFLGEKILSDTLKPAAAHNADAIPTQTKDSNLNSQPNMSPAGPECESGPRDSGGNGGHPVNLVAGLIHDKQRSKDISSYKLISTTKQSLWHSPSS